MSKSKSECWSVSVRELQLSQSVKELEFKKPVLNMIKKTMVTVECA